MRFLLLTAHLADADLAQRTLARATPPARVDACASVRDVVAQLGRDPEPDGVLVDTTPPTPDPLGALAEIRASAPHAVLVALVRPGADAIAAEALVAGADDTLVKQQELFAGLPTLVARLKARRAGGPTTSGPRVLLVATAERAMSADALPQFDVAAADEAWWDDPAGRTSGARAEVVVLTDERPPASVAAAVKALRQGTVLAPVVLLAADPSAAAVAMYERVGVAQVLADSERSRLPDVLRAVVDTARLSAQLALVRARERRLRALVESVPASVILVAPDGNVLAVNVAGLVTIGARQTGDIVGRPLATLGDPAAAGDVRAFIARVCQGTAGVTRFQGRGLEGTPRTFEIRAVPLPREQDSTVMLGVVRVVPATDLSPGASRTPASSDVEALSAELTSLREALVQERATHAELREALAAAGSRQAVQDAAWGAIRSELQRKLILQASVPESLEARDQGLAALEQAVRQRDQQLLSASEAHQASEAARREAESALQAAREALAAREAELGAEVSALRSAMHGAAGRAEQAERAAEAREHQLTAALAREQDLRELLAAREAEVEQLRVAAEQQAREHEALSDVRQQVARLQAAAATAEQQQRALDEAHDQIHRLRAALEDALGTHTDLERTIHERETERAAMQAERDASAARVRELEAALEALPARTHEATKEWQARYDAAQRDIQALQDARNGAQAALAAERDARAGFEALAAVASAARDEALAALAAREADFSQLQAEVSAAREERASLRQALAHAEQARTGDVDALDGLRARVSALEAELDQQRAALEGATRAERELREAVAAAEAARDEAVQALDALRRAQQDVLDDGQSLRAQIADLQARLAEQRQLAATLETERAALHDRLGRGEAASQLMASRQREVQEAAERALAELRARIAELEAAASSERAALEQALAAKESALRRMAVSGVIGLATTASGGALIACNDALARFCGYASGDDLLRRVGSSGLPLVGDWAAFQRLLASSAGPVTVEACLQKPDGSVAWLQGSAVAGETGPSGPQVEWTIVDATERYLRVSQQRQARRLEALRDHALSAGAELVETLSAQATDAAGAARADAGPLPAQARARDLARQILAYAQKQARAPHLVDVAEQVRNLRMPVERLAGEDVTLEMELPDHPLVATADPVELDHWVTSLTVLARDALPTVGRLTLSLAGRDLVLGAPGEAPRVVPVATLALRASGHGVRAVSLPSSIRDAIAQRGGAVRVAHDAVAQATIVEVHLPLVASLAGHPVQ